LETSKGRLSFQEYFVRERHSVEVSRVQFVGAEQSQPAPGLLEAIASADVVVFAPSNPVTSIGPILAVPGIREALRHAAGVVVAVSPIIGDAAVSGPAAALMRMRGWPSTIQGVAQAYDDFLNVLVVDNSDAQAADALTGGHLRVVCTNTLMRSADDKLSLARVVLDSSLRIQHQSGSVPFARRREPARLDPSTAKEARSG
ncbi:MAG TPA: 2-phospho-L-lactate transferase CofD family protein, partial [Paraburkholderia sp.]|uniref:2-phospho-L-lactate transferase CofD family protein n=1 Tax=Paraburkholderia sp. TaxID=1926495 RepID=UPI002CC297BC